MFKKLFPWFMMLAACAAPSFVNEPSEVIEPKIVQVNAGPYDFDGGGTPPVCCTGVHMTQAVSAQEPPVFDTTWNTAPDDGSDAKASDIRQLAELTLTNDAFMRIRRSTFTYDIEEPAFTFIIFSQDVYEAPGSGGYIEFPNAKIGDTIAARLTCLAQNGETSTGNGNRLRLVGIDDYGGGGETTPAAVPGARAYINAPDEQIVPTTIGGEWIVTVDGTTRIYMEGRVDTEPGELRIQSAVFMSGEHRRAATETILP